jgi:hypothetical protein
MHWAPVVPAPPGDDGNEQMKSAGALLPGRPSRGTIYVDWKGRTMLHQPFRQENQWEKLNRVELLLTNTVVAQPQAFAYSNGVSVT